MASGSELPEYSSSVKRRKIEGQVYGVSVPSDLDFSETKPTRQSPRTDLEEPLSGDSGFTELSEGSKSMSTTPDLMHLTPSRTDSTSDDTGCPLDTADEKDEVSSTVSNLSDLSGLSDLSEDSGHLWRNASSWVQKQMITGTNPRELLQHLLMDPTQIPEQVDDITLWKLVLNIMSDPPRRHKLEHINTLADVVRLIKNSKKIIVLTGAGVSVSCGIPDFRSRDGIYSRLAQDFPDLPDPQAMFDINYFGQDPRPFFKFAREIYPGQFKPSPCHRFIKMLDKKKKLLRNYSQNIDTLEQVAGIENVIECHGSFATASCTKCKYQVTAEDIRADIFAQRIPLCPKCFTNSLPSLSSTNTNDNYSNFVSQGIMKPDIVFFGEGLPDAFHDAIANDKDECDLLIVIGSSLKVRPVALIPSSIPSHVPQILINRESLPHLKFDIELLGDGDIIINQLCHLIGDEFEEICWKKEILEETPHLLPPRFITDDSWERSQDSTINQELSQDSTEVVLKTYHNVSTESQDSLMINSNTTPKRLENTDICISPFHAGHMEAAEESFALLGESPKRPLGDSSIESSPKRINLDVRTSPQSSSSGFTSRSLDDSEEISYSASRYNRVISVESTSENNGHIYNLEECHVVPRIINDSQRYPMSSSDDSIDNNRLNNSNTTADVDSSNDSEELLDSNESNGKPRHISIDSAIDSGLGDSCNSVDSSDEKGTTDQEDSKRHNLQRHCWQPEVKESLASRLPENTYYQVSSGKYIFTGAEIYIEPPDDYEQLSSSSSRSPTMSTMIRPESEYRST
ncbi:GSCOCG00005833001-RA-CDS [Cotesia congregata]|uniref:protein acetyllysine N-acetyltransferase n=1 Tax=Cotesia congregata TaxID=51543 RepID=A0A8J2HTC1_COTCN|nr:GSCOCG00005833001-RA-CDS [Cotesia congregata]CAG5107989.1 Similar to Sirt1: NAD-dependent histone deacetylase sirtuin-1 (Drosophila melanogaster) [Cotesia congregata]